MSSRAQTWQTTLADLALILFVALGSAGLSSSDKGNTAAAASSAAPRPEQGLVTLALWEGRDAASLRAWMAAQQPDARATLEVTIGYSPAERSAAWKLAAALDETAGARVAKRRIVLVPDSRDRVQAALLYR